MYAANLPPFVALLIGWRSGPQALSKDRARISGVSLRRVFPESVPHLDLSSCRIAGSGAGTLRGEWTRIITQTVREISRVGDLTRVLRFYCWRARSLLSAFAAFIALEMTHTPR